MVVMYVANCDVATSWFIYGSVVSFMLWQHCANSLVRSATKSTWLGLGKDVLSMFFFDTNMAGSCPEIRFKISCGVRLPDVETQSRTVVSGLAGFSSVTLLPSPPSPGIEVRT